MEINKELIQKYNQPVPRYTSYPPANYFTEGFSYEKYIKAVSDSNEWEPNNISFYIHIPFCHRLCFYCGCNSCPIAKEAEVIEYIKALKKEIQLVIPFIDNSRKVSQIHYGGGTPNSINVQYLKEINQLLFDAFKFIDNPEIAIECHPGYLDYEYVDGLKQAGFNRFSLGIQDFDTTVLKNVNRLPSKLPLSDLMEYIRKDGNISVNLDFIYGLPGQSVSSFTQTIERAIELQPDRMVTFSYAHVPWVNKNQEILERKGLPTSDVKIEMFEAALNKIVSSGYKMVGMDHYVQEKDELYIALKEGKLHRNFQGYCTRRTTGQVYAFGVSAISQLEKIYVQNTKSIDEYTKLLEQGVLPVIKGYELSDNERIIRAAITELMCNKVLVYNEVALKFGIDKEVLKSLLTLNDAVLNSLTEDDIIRWDDEKINVTDQGVLFIRNVAASLDPLMQNKTKTFSKSV